VGVRVGVGVLVGVFVGVGVPIENVCENSNQPGCVVSVSVLLWSVALVPPYPNVMVREVALLLSLKPTSITM